MRTILLHNILFRYKSSEDIKLLYILVLAINRWRKQASLFSLAVTNRVSVDFLSFPYYNDLVREVTIKGFP